MVDLAARAAALRVLRFLETHGASVTWDGAGVVVSPPHREADGVIDALGDLLRPGEDGQSVLDQAWSRHQPRVLAVKAARPPDAPDTQWGPAIEGLQIFLLSGHGDEALRLGWSENELFSVPSRWPNVSQTGAGLLIGDRKITSITPAEIRIKVTGDATQPFYRKPEVDYGLVFRERLKLIVGNYAGGSDEPRLRAIDHTINVCRANTGADLEQAKGTVLAAIAGAAR